MVQVNGVTKLFLLVGGIFVNFDYKVLFIMIRITRLRGFTGSTLTCFINFIMVTRSLILYIKSPLILNMHGVMNIIGLETLIIQKTTTLSHITWVYENVSERTSIVTDG